MLTSEVTGEPTTFLFAWYLNKKFTAFRSCRYKYFYHMLIFIVLPDLQKDFRFGMFCFLTSTELSASTSYDFSTFSTTCHVILIHRHTLPFCLLLCRAFFSLTTSLYLHINFILSSSYWLLIIFWKT